jgi:hypothetical protein
MEGADHGLVYLGYSMVTVLQPDLVHDHCLASGR